MNSQSSKFVTSATCVVKASYREILIVSMGLIVGACERESPSIEPRPAGHSASSPDRPDRVSQLSAQSDGLGQESHGELGELLDLAAKRPAAAAERLDDVVGSTDRRRLLERIISTWQLVNPRALFAWAAQSLSGNERNCAMSAAINRLLELDDFDGARELLGQMPYSTERKSIISEYAREWARDRPREACNWACSIDDPAERLTALAGMAGVIAGSDIELAKSLLHDSGIPKLVKRRLVISIANANVISLESAQDFVDSLPGELADDGRMAVQKVLSQIDPRLAIDYLESFSPEHISDAARIVLREVLKRDPLSASNALLDMNLDATKKAGLAEWFVGLWYNSDSIAASQWVAELQEGEVRDAAIGELASSLKSQDLDAAFTWAREIGNEELRKNVIEYLEGYAKLPRLNQP